MNKTYDVIEFVDCMSASTLNWIDDSSIKQTKKIAKEVVNDPAALQKFMYEEWCKTKLRVKHVE
ncbi:MAG: hypothetical protein Q4E33_05560 [Erysipelotrichaceae bacterium]|nr:hypothetical protein [Erysipelotrichaceae bacterium]